MSDFIAYKTLVIPSQTIADTDFSKIDAQLKEILRAHAGSRQSELLSEDSEKSRNAARVLVSRYFQVEQE
jgi:hypothetical protein